MCHTPVTLIKSTYLLLSNSHVWVYSCWPLSFHVERDRGLESGRVDILPSSLPALSCLWQRQGLGTGQLIIPKWQWQYLVFCTKKSCTWIKQNMFISFFLQKIALLFSCFSKSAVLCRQSLFCKSSKRFACTFIPSPCLYNYDQFDSVCIPSIKFWSFTQHLLCWMYKRCI